MLIRELTYEQEYNAKYRDVAKCPACGECREGEVNKNNRWKDKALKCTDRFHRWFCSNNYSDRKGCHGHSYGDLRCMDQP